MTAKELLKPRFEVIELYPKSKYEIGQILTETVFEHYSLIIKGRNFTSNMPNIEKYPHLFKKLNWWEKRKEEDMPKKVISLCYKDYKDFDISKQEVHHILKWDMKTLNGFINIEKRQVCSLISFSPEYGYIPVD